MKCAAKDCTHEATAGVALNVPSYFFKVVRRNPDTRLLLGLELCPACMAKTTPKDFLGHPNRMIETCITLGSKPAKPRFAEAYITPVDFLDPEWIMLKHPKPRK